MTVSELKAMIDVMISLGHGDAELVIDDSRDGSESFPLAVASPARVASSPRLKDDRVVLLVRYE